jgi:hypothetical protein
MIQRNFALTLFPTERQRACQSSHTSLTRKKSLEVRVRLREPIGLKLKSLLLLVAHPLLQLKMGQLQLAKRRLKSRRRRIKRRRRRLVAKRVVQQTRVMQRMRRKSKSEKISFYCKLT